MSLVASLFNGSEESKSIFIHDTFESNGRPLLKYAICELTKRYDKVQVVMNDVPAEHWVQGLPQDVIARLNIQDIQDSITSMETVHPNWQTPLVLDSLSLFLLHHFTPATCRWLHQHAHTFCLLHSDLYQGGVLTQINYMATSLLKVTNARPTCSGYIGNVYTIHRKASGRILRQVILHCITHCSFILILYSRLKYSLLLLTMHL